MLELEQEYFNQRQSELASTYPGKFVLIKGCQLVGAFDTQDDALVTGVRQFDGEPFLIRPTDYQASEIRVPALTMGILRADSSRAVRGQGAHAGRKLG